MIIRVLVCCKRTGSIQFAPIAINAANSSSACTIAYFFLPVSLSILYFSAYFSKASTKEVEGVMGYHETTVAPPKQHLILPLYCHSLKFYLLTNLFFLLLSLVGDIYFLQHILRLIAKRVRWVQLVFLFL